MNVEVASPQTVSTEVKKDKVYSSNTDLNRELSALDRRIACMGAVTVGIREATNVLGFNNGDRKLYEAVRTMIMTAYDQKMFKSELREKPSGHFAFNRDNILLIYTFIQLKGQDIPWFNIPYIAYHYLEDQDVRSELARAKKPYDEKKSVQDKESSRLDKFRKRAGNLLLKAEELRLDLTESNIFSNIPGEFLPQAEYSFEVRRLLTEEDLKNLLNVISDITQSKAVDPVSAYSLQGTGFDLRDVDTVVSNYLEKSQQNSHVSADITELCWWEVKRMLTELINVQTKQN